MKALTREQVTTLLNGANLGGLCDVIMTGIEELQKQAASTAFVLNNTKFKAEGRCVPCLKWREGGAWWRGARGGGGRVGARAETHITPGCRTTW